MGTQGPTTITPPSNHAATAGPLPHMGPAKAARGGGHAVIVLLQCSTLSCGSSHTLFNTQVSHPGAKDLLFFNMAKDGEPFSSATTNNFCRAMFLKLGALPSKDLNPHKFRHIFVGERRSSSAVTGPAEGTAALMMGHNVRMWDLYEGRWMGRQVEECLVGMQKWRGALLAKVAAQEDGQDMVIDLGSTSDDE